LRPPPMRAESHLKALSEKIYDVKESFQWKVLGLEEYFNTRLELEMRYRVEAEEFLRKNVLRKNR